MKIVLSTAASAAIILIALCALTDSATARGESVPSEPGSDCRLGAWVSRGTDRGRLDLESDFEEGRVSIRGALYAYGSSLDRYVFEDADGYFSIYSADGSLVSRMHIECAGNERLSTYLFSASLPTEQPEYRTPWLFERDETEAAPLPILREWTFDLEGRSVVAISADHTADHWVPRFDVPGADRLNQALWEWHVGLVEHERWCRYRFARRGKPATDGGSEVEILAWTPSLITLRQTGGVCGGAGRQWRTQTYTVDLTAQDGSGWRGWLRGLEGLSGREISRRLAGSPWISPDLPALMDRYLEGAPENCTGAIEEGFDAPVITPQGMEFHVTLAHSGSYIWNCQFGAEFSWLEICEELTPAGRQLMREVAASETLAQIEQLEMDEIAADVP
jgi:hypothetical protein